MKGMITLSIGALLLLVGFGCSMKCPQGFHEAHTKLEAMPQTTKDEILAKAKACDAFTTTYKAHSGCKVEVNKKDVEYDSRVIEKKCADLHKLAK